MRSAGFIPLTESAKTKIEDEKVRFQRALAERGMCVAEIRSQPRYQALLAHLASRDTGKFTLEQLADDSRPDPSEAHSLLAYFDAASTCFDHYAREADAIVPGSSAIFNDYVLEQQKLLLRAVYEKLTWGDLAQESQRLGTEFNGKFKNFLISRL